MDKKPHFLAACFSKQKLPCSGSELLPEYRKNAKQRSLAFRKIKQPCHKL